MTFPNTIIPGIVIIIDCYHHHREVSIKFLLNEGPFFVIVHAEQTMSCPGWPHFHRYFYRVARMFFILSQCSITYLLSLTVLNHLPWQFPLSWLHMSRLLIYPMMPHSSLPCPSPLSTFSRVSAIVWTAKGNSALTNRKQSSHSQDFLLCDVQPLPENTVASQNRNCLDLPSSQHNDSIANETGLELGPNSLKRRDYQWKWRKPVLETSKGGQAAVYLFPIIFLFCLLLPVKLG